jgi:plasmid stability protein
MRRMMIQADDELLDRARRRAAERGVSVAQIVREALARELGTHESQPEVRSIGAFRSGGTRPPVYEPPPFRS